MKLYVGNLNYKTTPDLLQQIFSQHGTVTKADIVKDRDSGRSKGFGFVTMDDVGGSVAIQALDGYELQGRTLRVTKAKDQEPSRSRA